MSAFHAALGGMVTATGVGMVMVARNWPTPTGTRRRRGDDISDELMTELLGPPSPYTAFEHAPAPIRPCSGHCEPCGQTTAGSLNRDGWLCGECLTPTIHTSTGVASR